MKKPQIVEYTKEETIDKLREYLQLLSDIRIRLAKARLKDKRFGTGRKAEYQTLMIVSPTISEVNRSMYRIQLQCRRSKYNYHEIIKSLGGAPDVSLDEEMFGMLLLATKVPTS